MSKTVFENDKILVDDNVLKPGEESPSQDRSGRVLYYISGGTLERTFADGTKESVVRKTGQSLMVPRVLFAAICRVLARAGSSATSGVDPGTYTLHHAKML